MTFAEAKTERARGAVRGLLGLAVGVAIAITSGGDARAEPTRDAAAAETFFAEGRALLKAGRLAEACSKFEASQRLDPANGTLMNLADCYEKVGRLASSWLAFREAAASAEAAGQAARASHARTRAATIEPRLCRLRVDVHPSIVVPVLRDGTTLDRAVWGESVPVDAGTHTVVVRSGGLDVWTRSVDVSPATPNGPCETVSVSIPAIPGTDVAPETTPPPAPTTAPASSAPPPPDRPAPIVVTRRSPIPLVVAGVGAVSMGVGAVFGLAAKSSWDDAKSKCTPDGCGEAAQSLADTARRDATLGSVGVIGGGVLLAGGVVWWLLAPAEEVRTTARVRFVPGPSGVAGTF